MSLPGGDVPFIGGSRSSVATRTSYPYWKSTSASGGSCSSTIRRSFPASREVIAAISSCALRTGPSGRAILHSSVSRPEQAAASKTGGSASDLADAGQAFAGAIHLSEQGVDFLDDVLLLFERRYRQDDLPEARLRHGVLPS